MSNVFVLVSVCPVALVNTAARDSTLVYSTLVKLYIQLCKPYVSHYVIITKNHTKSSSDVNVTSPRRNCAVLAEMKSRQACHHATSVRPDEVLAVMMQSSGNYTAYSTLGTVGE